MYETSFRCTKANNMYMCATAEMHHHEIHEFHS